MNAERMEADLIYQYCREAEEAHYRYEMASAAALSLVRDPEGRLVSRHEIAVRCGLDDDEPDPRPVLPLEGRHFIPCDELTLADLADIAQPIYAADVDDEEDPDAELAAWCRANRRLCRRFDWSTQGYNLPRAPRPWSPRRTRRTRPAPIVEVVYVG